MTGNIAIREIGAAEAEARLGQLAAILVDAVQHGASVNFLAGLTMAEAASFWRGQIPGIADKSRYLLAPDDGAAIVGTVMLTLALQPNQSHRAYPGLRVRPRGGNMKSLSVRAPVK